MFLSVVHSHTLAKCHTGDSFKRPTTQDIFCCCFMFYQCANVVRHSSKLKWQVFMVVCGFSVISIIIIYFIFHSMCSKQTYLLICCDAYHIRSATQWWAHDVEISSCKARERKMKNKTKHRLFLTVLWRLLTRCWFSTVVLCDFLLTI